jgi:hypothetical protein
MSSKFERPATTGCVELSTREAARAVSPALVLVSHGPEKTHSVEIAIPRTVYFESRECAGTMLADYMTLNLKTIQRMSSRPFLFS